MNLEAYAKHRKARGLRGTSHVAVLKAIDTGRLTEPAVRKVNGRWQIDPTLADMQWAGNTDTARIPDAPQPTGPLPAPPNSRQPHPAGSGPSLAEAKRARAVYEAELTRIELMKERQELILASEVKAEAFALARALRDGLLSLADRLAPMLAATTDARECHRLLTEEHRIALRGLADG